MTRIVGTYHTYSCKEKNIFELVQYSCMFSTLLRELKLQLEKTETQLTRLLRYILITQLENRSKSTRYLKSLQLHCHVKCKTLAASENNRQKNKIFERLGKYYAWHYLLHTPQMQPGWRPLLLCQSIPCAWQGSLIAHVTFQINLQFSFTFPNATIFQSDTFVPIVVGCF